jgi:lysophospholipase L1-like esterase
MSLLAGAAILVLLAGCAATRLRDAAELARLSEPFQRPLSRPDASLLIVGDSTAVGTGASRPDRSLAGLLASEFPGLQIVNRGRDGATFADLPAQLAGEDRFDAVLILAGGNDVIRLRDLAQAGAQLDQTLREASTLGKEVVVMPAGNVGNAPFFLPPVSWWMTSRSRDLHAVVRAAAERHGAAYVGLFKEREEDPFA